MAMGSRKRQRRRTGGPEPAGPDAPAGEPGLFESVAANLPGAIYRCRPDDWGMVYLGGAFEAITGFKAADFLGEKPRLFMSLLHPDERDRVVKHFRDCCARGDAFEDEFRIVRADGAVRWVQERARPVSDVAGRTVWLDGILLDITERKAAEAALQASEAHFRAAMENLPSAVYRASADGWTLEFISGAIEYISGYTPQEYLDLYNRAPDEFYHPDDLPRFRELIGQSLATRQPLDFEYRFRHRDGDYRWALERGRVLLDDRGQVASVDGVITDITALKKAEAALQASEARFRTLVENSPNAIFRTEPDGWTFLFVSGVIEQLTGYTPDEYIRLHEGPLEELFHPDDLPTLKTAVASALRMHQMSDVEYRFRHKNGEWRWILEHGRPVVDEAGKIKWYEGILTDITERKRMAERLAESEAMFRSIVTSVPGAVYRKRYDRQTKSTVLVYLSEGIERIVGYSAGEIFTGVNVELADLIHPEDASTVEEATNFTIATGEPYSIEIRLLRRDGTVRWVECRGAAVTHPASEDIFVHGIIFDVTEQKRASEALAAAHLRLEESETRFRTMVGNVPGAIYRCRPNPGWAMEYVSDAIEAITGYPASEFLGGGLRSFANLVDPDDAPKSFEQLRRELEGGQPITAEFRVRHRDGSRRWIYERARGVLDDRGRLIAVDGVLLDITAQKLAEAEAERTALLIRQIIDHAPVQINIKDIEGRYQLVNRALEKDMGRPLSEIIGRTVYELYPKDAAEVTTANHRRVVAERHPIQHEQTVIRGEHVQHLVATRFPVFDAAGDVIAVGYVGADVTALRAAESEAARAVQMIQQLVDHSPAYITIKDPAGRYRLVNREVERIAGRPRHEMLGKTAYDFFPPEIAARTQAVIDRVLAERRPVFSEAEEERVEGEARYYAPTRFPVFDEDGEVMAVCNIAIDVTEKVASAHKLEELAASLALARDEAEGASRAKSEFLAVMSHELRTPLNGILGMTSLLLESGLKENQRGYAEAVQSSTRFLNTLIHDILDYSRLEAGKVELDVAPLEPAELVERALALFAPQLRDRSVELCGFVAPSLPRLRGDAARLGQIINNLLDNALKFTEEGGVSLEVTGRLEGPSEVVLRIEVVDTGIGIDPDAFPRLLEHFTQADTSISRQFGGTGLGLAIVKELVELMEGDIGADGAPGRGSRFWVNIPLKVASAGAGEDDARAQWRGASALVVTANPVVRRELKRQLEAWGIDAQALEQGRAALSAFDQARSRGEAPVLVLAASELADMTGRELAQLLREKAGTGLKIVELAAPQASALNGCDPAFDAQLARPVRPLELRKTLGRLLAGPAPAGIAGEASAAFAAELPSPRRKRLLLVEDNEVNLKLVATILHKAGYDYDAAANGRLAVEKAGREDYDAILMDVRMPVMDGLMATQAIRDLPGARGRIPIIAVTANVLRGDRARSLDAGMDDYLTKPVRQEELLAMVEKWIGPGAPREEDDTAAPDAVDNRAAVLDETIVSELESALGREMLSTLVGENIAAVREQIGRIFHAVKEEDIAALQREAHDLKSTLGSFGALDASRRAAAIEEACKKGQCDEAMQLLPDVERAVAAATTTLAARYLMARKT